MIRPDHLADPRRVFRPVLDGVVGFRARDGPARNAGRRASLTVMSSTGAQFHATAEATLSTLIEASRRPFATLTRDELV